MSGPEFKAPSIPAAPVTITTVDAIITQVINTPYNVFGLVMLAIKAAALSFLFALRDRLEAAALRRAKQLYEQGNTTDNQNEVDQPEPTG